MAGYLGSVPVPQATQHRETFTATAGQTTFNTAGYTPLFIDVYLNGVHLSPADITATNGSDVVLGACVVNDIVDIVSYTPFEVASQTFTGTTTMTDVVAASLDISGNIDIDGTTNLDVVDIDGAVDMASTLGVAGVVTANAGVVVDNFTLDGTTLALSSGNFTLDVAGTISLDADGADIMFKDGGTEFGRVYNSSNDFALYSAISDQDMKFQGNDGGSLVTALTLDMSDAGAATFNSNVGIGVAPATAYGSALQIHDSGTSGANLRLTDSNTGSGTGNGMELLAINADNYWINRENGPIFKIINGQSVQKITTTATEIQSGNLGIGVTPDTFSSGYTALQINGYAYNIAHSGGDHYITNNAYYNSSWKYGQTSTAQKIEMSSGLARIFTAASGSADADITWVEGLRVGVSESVFNEASDNIDFRIESDGIANMLNVDGQHNSVCIGNNTTSHRFIVHSEVSGDHVAAIRNDGNNTNKLGLVILAGTDDNSGTNTMIQFRDGDNTDVGAITASGGTVTYAAFTAVHPAILPDEDNANGYAYGTLVETTSVSYEKNSSGNDFERGIIYNVTKSTSANSRSVLGAYSGKLTDWIPSSNKHNINVLGDGHILCNNSGGNIAVGDGICTSATAGIGQKATASPSMIIGIAQEAVTFSSGTETKLVPVQYGLQQFTPWS
jgi:hypothetical protein